MERLHLDPLDVLHRRDKAGDALDIRRIVGRAGNEREPDPDRLGYRSKALGKAQGGREVPAGHPPVGGGIRALDVEQNMVDHRQVGIVGAIAQKSRCLDRRMQAHFLGAGEYSSGECELHHRLAARYRQASTQAADRGREVAEPAQHVIDRHVGAVLEMPGVRIMAVRAAQQASGDEEDDAQPRPVIARRGFVGMAISERALFVLDVVFVRGVGRNPNPEVVTTSGFEGLNRRHRDTRLDLAVERTADHISLLFGRQTNEVHGIARHADRELRDTCPDSSSRPRASPCRSRSGSCGTRRGRSRRRRP